MSNYTQTTVKCNSLTQTELCFKRLSQIIEEAGSRTEVDYQAEGFLSLSTRNGMPTWAVIQLSEEFPELTLTAEHLQEYDGCSEKYIETFFNGEGLSARIEPSYVYPYINGFWEKNESAKTLMNIAIDFFKRIDIVKKVENGKFNIEWEMNPVSYIVENEDYKFTATKKFNSIEITELFEKVKTENIELKSIELPLSNACQCS